VHDLAELADLKAGLARKRVDVGAQLLDAVLVAGDEILPALGGEFRDAVEPARVELGALVVLEELLAAATAADGKGEPSSRKRIILASASPPPDESPRNAT